jgi:hypothetical protein
VTNIQPSSVKNTENSISYNILFFNDNPKRICKFCGCNIDVPEDLLDLLFELHAICWQEYIEAEELYIQYRLIIKHVIYKHTYNNIIPNTKSFRPKRSYLLLKIVILDDICSFLQ